MHHNKEITNEESFAIIRQMIEAAKADQKDDGMGWILWGWLLLSVSVLTIINIRLGWFQTFFFWNLFGIAALVMLMVGIVKTFMKKKRHSSPGYMKDVFEKLNLGFTLFLLIIIVAMNLALQPVIGFALITALYGFWILIYGALLNFKPSIIAAYIVFALALTGLFAKTFEAVMVLHCIAVIAGYLVPGHIANKEFEKLNTSKVNGISV